MTNVAAYLTQILGIEIQWNPWGGSHSLPAFLLSRYSFFEMKILGKQILVLQLHADEPLVPTALAKHMDFLRKIWSDDLVFVCDRMDAFLRQRLIERQIPFVTPFNQAYLPNLGIDLREYYRSAATRTSGTSELSPAAQAVFLYLLQSEQAEHTTSSLHKDLGYTIMTLNRALDALAERELVCVNTEKWKKVVTLSKSRSESWNSAQAALSSPLKRTEYVNRKFVTTIANTERMLKSGISALAMLTDIAETTDTYAIDAKTFTRIKKMNGFLPSRKNMPEAAEIEIWSYDPKVLSPKSNRTVDVLSLSLTLKNSPDERIQAALTTALKEVQHAWH
jgi:hypothetical protein